MVERGQITRSVRGQWHLADAVSIAEPESNESGTSSSLYPEGEVNYVLHRNYERDPRLKQDLLTKRQKESVPIRCDACEFDFKEFYGIDYIECHHTIPVARLHELELEGTVPEDVVLLCANCHRWAHRQPKLLTPEQLRGRWVKAST
jgi:predicted HNH restriction endonuclease